MDEDMTGVAANIHLSPPSVFFFDWIVSLCIKLTQLGQRTKRQMVLIM